MERWEHRTVLIQRDESGWAIQFADGSRLQGLDQILDEYGSKGWELVTLQPQTYVTAAGQFGPFEAGSYRAVFKRRLAAPEPSA
ncbi:MAG TPA: DUF4177 domain-containing protein [Chloroflexota bacterium]|jgi:hypothetical protein|nr:DUF4177 domain-containing protein [Chloroflexota bacterium]